MRKSRVPEPKHLQICLTIPPQLFDFSGQSQFSKSSSNIIQSSLCQRNMTKENTCQVRDVIRLGSKKKRMKREQKQNVIYQNSNQSMSTPKPEKPNSLNKYFLSANKILTSSSLFNSKNNIQCPETDQKSIKKRQKTQINNEYQYKSSKRLMFQKFDEKKDKKSLSKSRASRNYSKSINSSKNLLHQDRQTSLNRKLRNQSSANKLQTRLKKMKQYRFIQQYLSDLELQGIFNELQITGVPEAKWPLIVVDKVYELIRRKNFNIPHEEIIRKF